MRRCAEFAPALFLGAVRDGRVLTIDDYFMPWANQMVNCANCQRDPGKGRWCRLEGKLATRYWRICKSYRGRQGGEERPIIRKRPAKSMGGKIMPSNPPVVARAPTKRCGAKTRQGQSCAQPGLHANGRCRYHGGLSTGPVTAKGRAKSAMNGIGTRFGSSTRPPRIGRKR